MAKAISTLRYMAKAIRSAVEGNMWYRRIGQLFLDILDKVEEGGGGTGKVDWDNLEGKPDTYPPSAHKHQTTDINNFSSAVASAVQGAGVATQTWVEWYAAQNNLQPKEFKPTINDLYNGYIQELYIEGSYDGQMAIYLLQDTSQDTRLFISDGNGHTIGKCVIEGSESFVPGNIYEIVDDDYYSGLHGYVVFSKAIPSGLRQQAESDSLINNSVKNIFNSPMIFNKIFGWLAPKKETGVEWTDNSSVNEVIEEFYYPTLPSGASIYLLTDTDESARLFVKNSSGALIAKCGRVINKNIRNSKPIYSIYDNDTGRTLLGYFILSTERDYNQQGTFVIKRDNVINLSNSPSIKAMLEDKRQLILLGDSIPSLMSYYDDISPVGYYTAGQENPLEDMLRSMLGCQVINLCCEGCTYALRTTLATNYYDKFSAVKWAESISSKSFSTQKNAIVGNNIAYPRSIANTALIDWDKKTTIICEYGTNDLTIGSFSMGDMYSGDTITTAAKRTIMGAMTYAAQTILNRYPLWKMCFVNLFNRTIDGTPISLYTNSTTGISAQTLRDALAENAERLGLPIVLGTDMAERNMFSLMTATCDGTHNNEVGFFALAKFYARIYERINGNDKEESAVVMDITGEGGDIGTNTPDSGDTGGGEQTGAAFTISSNGGTGFYEFAETTEDGHSCYVNTNQGVQSSSSRMIILTTRACTIHYKTSSENGSDYLQVTPYGASMVVRASGITDWSEAALEANTTYYIVFYKDSSVDANRDSAWWYIN